MLESFERTFELEFLKLGTSGCKFLIKDTPDDSRRSPCLELPEIDEGRESFCELSDFETGINIPRLHPLLQVRMDEPHIQSFDVTSY